MLKAKPKRIEVRFKILWRLAVSWVCVEFTFLINVTPLLEVTLGSSQELPAESCSEIKASEGKDMADGDFWIYSDGTDHVIKARCKGKNSRATDLKEKKKSIFS